MSGDFSGGDPRVPPPFAGIQVNFCKNVECGHFGEPASTEKQPRGPGARERENDGYILGSKDGFRTRLICKACGQYSILKSNRGVAEERRRLRPTCTRRAGAALLPPPGLPEPRPRPQRATPRPTARTGRAPAAPRRYRCKACGRTFSRNARPAARQRLTHKNKAVFKELVNLTPFKRLCEVAEIRPTTLYRKIDFLHSPVARFRRPPRAPAHHPADPPALHRQRPAGVHPQLDRHRG